MSSETQSKPLYQNLDSTFVNLWALLRKLSQEKFIGRVHVELKDYTADIFVNGSPTPLVREVDHAAGTDVTEEGALHRVVLRARESPGTISVFAGPEEVKSSTSAAIDTIQATPMAEVAAEETSAPIDPAPQIERPATPPPTSTFIVQPEPRLIADWNEVVKLSGELIGAVDRSLTESGADFNAVFERIRLELGDDFTFLDPMQGRFGYAKGSVVMLDELPNNIYVAAVCEALRRVIDRVASGDRGRRVRERVALEFALLVRKREEAMRRSGFHGQLDRIAGARVI